jgi:DNA-binding transcriptional ArsR family regulator
MPTEILERIANRLKALADPTRLAILHSLQEGPMCVKDITEVIAARQANVSKHLGILRQAGLVRSSRNGAEVHYEVADPTALDICRLVCASLEKQACRAVEELGQGFNITTPPGTSTSRSMET